MTIPPGLNLLREANSCEAANHLLAEGWILISATVAFGPTREPNTYFLLGWNREMTPPNVPAEHRRSGNLAHDARL